MILDKIVPDCYLRYKIGFDLTCRILANKKANILDVGGTGSLLGDFIKKQNLPYKLTVIDTRKDNHKKTTCQKYIKDDFLTSDKLDTKYDLVTSFDVLEHIDNKKLFLDKITSLSKNIIISAPFYSRKVCKAEKQVNSFFKKFKKIDHPWLSEHFNSKLPRQNWLENYLNEKNLKFYKIGIANISNWAEILMLSFTPSFHKLNKNQQNRLENIYQFYNQNYQYLGEFDPPNYRTIYLITNKKLNLINQSELNLSKVLEFKSLIYSFFNDNLKNSKWTLLKSKILG